MANKALAYLRTSSIANVGKDKDSDTRQRLAIEQYAAANGIEIAGEYYDRDVKGSDPLEARRGFGQLLDRIESNGVRLILVEEPSRLARDSLVQEAGLAMLAARGVRVVTAGGLDMSDDSDPIKKMVRIIVGAVMAAEKDRLVAKLRGARDRATAARGYRKADQYEATQPGILDALASLRSAMPDATLQGLADGLNAQGYTTGKGTKLAPNQIRRLIERQGRSEATS